MRLLVTLFFAFVVADCANAQTHKEFWARLSFTKNIHHKWNTALDLNLRQQSNYWIGSKNNFELPMMRNARVWIIYNPAKKYSIVNTIALAETTDIKENKKELIKATELLYGIGILRKDSLKSIQIKSRLLAEIKNIQPQSGNNITICRYRLQNSISIPVKETSKQSALYAVANSELFFKTREKETGFDQYRISGLMQWHLHNTEYAVGIQETLQNQHDCLIKRNQLLFNINVYL